MASMSLRYPEVASPLCSKSLLWQASICCDKQVLAVASKFLRCLGKSWCGSEALSSPWSRQACRHSHLLLQVQGCLGGYFCHPPSSFFFLNLHYPFFRYLVLLFVNPFWFLMLILFLEICRAQPNLGWMLSYCIE